MGGEEKVRRGGTDKKERSGYGIEFKFILFS